jgi:predicted acetyltransferase
MELVSPSVQYESLFLPFLSDLCLSDLKYSEFYSDASFCFCSYVKSLNDQSKGINLPEGYVPCNHYWLITDNHEIAGSLRIRHNIESHFLSYEGGHIGYDIAPSFRRRGYGTHMLKLGLEKAKHLNLSSVLITANEDNVGSRKIIESNGGLLDDVVMGEIFPYRVARYWVNR